MSEQKMINWTQPMLERFKTAYRAAAPQGKDATFMFDDNEFVVGYAKYLIEHLDSQFGVSPAHTQN